MCIRDREWSALIKGRNLMEKIAFAAKPAAASNKIKFYHLSCERGELPLAGETEAYFIPFRTCLLYTSRCV